MKKFYILLALGIVLVVGSVVFADGKISTNGWPEPGTGKSYEGTATVWPEPGTGQ